MNLLFVCTGNTCRSPMAEALGWDYIQKNHLTGIEVSSAGVAAFSGDPAAKNAVEVLAEIGIDLSLHSSRPLSAPLIEQTDLFAVMTDSHAAVLKNAGIPDEKIHLLGPVSDPFGGDLATYRRCRDQLQAAIHTLFRSLGHE